MKEFTEGIDYQVVSAEIALKQPFYGHMKLFSDNNQKNRIKDLYVIFLKEFTEDEMKKCCNSIPLEYVLGTKSMLIELSKSEPK